MSMGPMQYAYIYSTAPGPLSLSNNADLTIHDAAKTSNPLPMYPPNGGSGAAILDFAPDPTGGEGYMHRTQTLDYVFMMEGEMELTMDGGERRVVKRGDVVVQRAVMHAWRNLSKTEPARMAVVSLGCEKVL
jgi:quercetin dioxygenase-like cupin family protein